MLSYLKVLYSSVCAGDVAHIAFAFLDAATNRVFIGAQAQDANHSALRTLLTHVAPREMLVPRGGFDSAALRCVRSTVDMKQFDVTQVRLLPHALCSACDCSLPATVCLASCVPHRYVVYILRRRIEEPAEAQRAPAAAAISFKCAVSHRCSTLDDSTQLVESSK